MQAHMTHASFETSVLMRPWFIILVLAGAVERLSGLALGVAMERDWVVMVYPYYFTLSCSYVSGEFGTHFRVIK